MLRGDILGRAFAHQAAERQRNARHDLAVAHQHVTALAHGLNSSHHIGSVITHDAHVVRVVADRGGNGATGDGEATHPAATDMLADKTQARRTITVGALGLQRHTAAVALDQHNATQALGALGASHTRDGLTRHHVNHGLARLKGIVEYVERKLRQLNGRAQLVGKGCDLGHLGCDLAHKGAVLRHQSTGGVYAMRSRGKRQVIEHQQVGTLARGDGATQFVRVAAAVIQAKRLSRGKGRHGDSDHRVDTGLNRHAAGVVDHAGRKRIGRSAVVGRKAATAGTGRILQQHRRQVGQVMAARTLAQHHIHAARQLVECLLGNRRLMVSDNTCCGIGVEVLAGNERRVTVNLLGRRLVGSVDSSAGLGIGHKDARQVHHLAQAKDIARMLGKKRLHVSGGNHSACLLIGQRGHARGHHVLDGNGRATAVLDHKAQAVQAGNVGDLVAVGNGSGGTARRRHARILGRADVRRLDMQVSVNKTGGKIAALAIDDLGSLIRTGGIVATIVEHTDDHAILDGNATGRHALAVHIDNLCVGKQRVNGHTTLGGLDHRSHDLNGHTYSFNRRKKLRSGQAFTAANQ